jgi:hypothetical protein
MMKHMYATAIVVVFMAFCGCRQTESSHAIKVSETDQGFLFAEGGDKVMFYQREHKSLDGKYTRANYIHPLYGLDGEVLTEDFPADHLHHRGVFWAWHQVWVGSKQLGDSWAVKDFFWDIRGVRVYTPDSESKALLVAVDWKSPLWTDANGNQKAFVKESTMIRVHRAEQDIRKVDFEISLLALEDNLRLGGSEDEKGYGGFTTRIPLPDSLAFIGADGPVEPQNLSVEGGPWMDFSGPLGLDGKISGIAILCHKSLPGYPQRWILRRKGSAQNPVFPGREPVPLSREKPLVLRYRLIIHRGDVHHVDLDKLAAEYNGEPPLMLQTK